MPKEGVLIPKETKTAKMIPMAAVHSNGREVCGEEESAVLFLHRWWTGLRGSELEEDSTCHIAGFRQKELKGSDMGLRHPSVVSSVTWDRPRRLFP